MGEQGTKRFYPVFLDLAGRYCVVIGGGASALKRARQLASYGADVSVVCSSSDSALAQAQADGILTLIDRDFALGDLSGAFMAVCVDPDASVRSAVRAEAEASACPLNVVGDPQMCSFIIPSVIHREPLQIAVSTGGFAPQLAKRLRQELSEQFGPEWREYTQLLGEARGLAFERLDDPASRDAFIAGLTESNLLAQVREGTQTSAGELLQQFTDAEHGSLEAAQED